MRLLAPLLMGGGSADGGGGESMSPCHAKEMQLGTDDALIGQGRQPEFSLLRFYQIF